MYISSYADDVHLKKFLASSRDDFGRIVEMESTDFQQFGQEHSETQAHKKDSNIRCSVYNF